MIFKEKEPGISKLRMAVYFFMKIFKKRFSIYPKLIVAMVLLMNLHSCYMPQEGCTDPESTNYAISADDLCEDCCTYPELRLSIFHENADTTFNLKDTITNDIGQQISLLNFVYLLSDFKIVVVDSSFEVIDLVSLNVSDGIEAAKDDIIRVSRNNFTFDLGTIIFDGNTNEISFRTGLSDLLNENRFTTSIEDHPLTNDTDSLFLSDSGTYVFQRIRVAQGIDFLDTVIYDIETATEISFPLDFESIRGTDKTIIIEAQYDKWFDGIDFDFMEKEEIEAAIAQNSSTVFRQKN